MRTLLVTSVLVSLAALSTVACNRSDAPPPSAASSATPATTTASAALVPSSSGAAKPSELTKAGTITETAAAGTQAPDFTLNDLDGTPVHLADYKGKIVVLEWFNPACPFVKNSHTVGSLVTTAKKHTTAGVVWLAINSGGAGKQGASLESNKEGAKTFSLTHPILLDESGKVGHAYGATNTPHMFVIDQKGAIAYRGAIDNSPDGERKSAPNDKVINYVDDAIEAVKSGEPVQTATTKAYGCGVKFGS